MPYLQEIPLDGAIIAPSIYGAFPHEVTNTGLVIEVVIKAELERFLREYTTYLGIAGADKYFRVDLYFDRNTVYVIEVNVEIADGWGVALNLLRAAGQQLIGDYTFPSLLPTFSGDPRQTEFKLAMREVALLGHKIRMEELECLIIDEYDNKVHLAHFADTWQSELVCIPNFYWQQKCRWNALPKDVYFKRIDTVGAKRQKIIPRKSCRRKNDFRQQYRKGRVIAQQQVSPFLSDMSEPIQAVAMCTHSQVVTGYIQVAPKGRNIINDKGTKKGALLFL